MIPLLDEPLKDINAKLLKPTRRKTSSNVISWAKAYNDKLAAASKVVRDNSAAVADWILSTDIPNRVSESLPVKVRDLIALVRRTKYPSDIQVARDTPSAIRVLSDDDLSSEKESAFKKNIVVYNLKVIDKIDYLKCTCWMVEKLSCW